MQCTRAAITFGSRRLISMTQKHKKPRGSLHSSALNTHTGAFYLSLFLFSHSTRAACAWATFYHQESRANATAPAVVLRNFLKSHHAPQSAHKSPFSPICEGRCALFHRVDNKFTSRDLLAKSSLLMPGDSRFRSVGLADSVGWLATDWEVSRRWLLCVWMRWTLLIRDAICHVLPTKGAIMRCRRGRKRGRFRFACQCGWKTGRRSPPITGLKVRHSRPHIAFGSKWAESALAPELK